MALGFKASGVAYRASMAANLSDIMRVYLGAIYEQSHIRSGLGGIETLLVL